MTEPEFMDCLRTACWISNNLLKKPYDAVFPLGPKVERQDGAIQWNFYVNWRGGMSQHANGVWVCARHNEVLLEMWQGSAMQDRKEQEVTEAWMTRVNSQMART